MLFTKFKWLWLLLLFVGLLAGCVREMSKTDTKLKPKQEEAITKIETTPKTPTTAAKDTAVNKPRHYKPTITSPFPYNYAELRECCLDIIENPHPKVKELNLGNHGSNMNRFYIIIDTSKYKQLSIEEAFDLTKEVLNFKDYEDIRYDETLQGDKHVGRITIDGFDVKDFLLRYWSPVISGRYNKNLVHKKRTYITFDEALKIAKNKANDEKYCWGEPGCGYPVKKQIFLERNALYKDNSTIYAHYFFHTSYPFSKGYTVMAETGKITHNTRNGSNAFGDSDCYKCDALENLDVDPNCNSRTENFNYLPFSSFTTIGQETNIKLPTFYDDCVDFASVNIVEYTDPVTMTTKSFRHYDIPFSDYKIKTLTNCMFNADDECVASDHFVSGQDNDFFTKEEMCAWNAINSLDFVQQFFADHFIDRGVFVNKTEYFDDIASLHIYLGWQRPTKAYYLFDGLTEPHIYLATGERIVAGNEDDKPFTNLEIIAHEYNHHLQWKNYLIADNINKNEETNALQEALADIYSVFAVNKLKGNNADNIDWVFGEDVVNSFFPNSPLPRNLSDPSVSARQQAVFYDTNWGEINSSNIPDFVPIFTNPSGTLNESNVPYFKAGVISHWFYLLAQGRSDVAGQNNVFGGIGIDAAEKILFKSLQLLRTKILAGDDDYKDKNINFVDFRNIVLEYTKGFNLPNSYKLCSSEYSKVYRAFEAVGLIDNSPSGDPVLAFPASSPLSCNVLSYENTIFTNCPTDQNLVVNELADGSFAIKTSFDYPLSTTGPFLIQAYVDLNSDNFFESTEEQTIQGVLEGVIVNTLDEYELVLVGVPTDETLIKLVVSDISEVINQSIGEPPTDDFNIPNIEFIFTINEGCNLIVGENPSDIISDIPPPNSGQVLLDVPIIVTGCVNSEICIDYTADGPEYMFTSISPVIPGTINIITQSGSSTTGQYCWIPQDWQVGNPFPITITATDGHPTNPVTSSTVVSVEIFDPNVWQTAGPIAYATNETSAGANNGSIEIHLGSTHNLEYHYTGPNGFSLVTTNNPVTGLANGLYNIDVYVEGTYCLYNSYTATVGTNSSGGTPVCTFNQDLIFMRALPAIFNDQTIIEVELQEKALQLNLAAFDMQGNPVQNLLNGQVLQTGTHQIPFDGSATPNGLYIFSLAVSIPQCRTGAQESISIKGFKY